MKILGEPAKYNYEAPVRVEVEGWWPGGVGEGQGSLGPPIL